MAYLEDILPQIRDGRKLAGADFDDKWMTMFDVLDNCWELAPDPVKHKAKVYLWSDGQITTRDDRIWVNGNHKVIETREIEWSVE